MSLPSRSAPRPDPEQKELWRFEVSVDHTPAFWRLKAPVNRGQLQRCLPLPTVTSACLACAGERTALSCRPRRSRRPSAPWSGGGDLSDGSRHGPVESCAYHLNPSAVFGATMLLGDVAPTLTTPPQGLPHASSRLSQVYWYYTHLP
jgi:hypothetical protein